MTVDTSTMNQSLLARALGISRQSVSKAKRQGMPVDSLEAAQAWRDARMNPARTKSLEVPKDSHIEEAVDAGETFEEALARRLRAEASLAELRAERERTSLISLSAVKGQMASDHLRFVGAATAMVREVAPRLAPMDDAPAIQTLLDEAIHALLWGLSGASDGGGSEHG